MYEVTTDNLTTILYKVSKGGKRTEQARTEQKIDGKVLIIPKHKKNTLIFKHDTRTPQKIDFVAVGGVLMGYIKNDVQVYTRPHYQEYHRVLMTENYNRYALAQSRHRQKKQELDKLRLDDKAILDNMLEYCGTI